ncbi:MAG: hypothetical protein JWP59_3430 [Massilia sp.]|nr:hypothetical protein [Massilia sp.]
MHYVFPEVATRIAVVLRARRQSGIYDEATDADEFARLLTADMLDVSHDKHLRIVGNDL